MFKRLRISVIIAGLLLTLLFFNSQIRALNSIKEDGVSVLFKLAPVDPRAFMQGDYMALRYDEESLPPRNIVGPPTGTAIIRVDANGVGTFARLDDGQVLSPNELRVNFTRLFGRDATYGGQRYFFQEGTAKTYEAGEYGIFKVSTDGRAILAGLADENRNTLTPPPNP